MSQSIVLRLTCPDFFVGPLLVPLPGTLTESPSLSPSQRGLRATYFDLRNRAGDMLSELSEHIDLSALMATEALEGAAILAPAGNSNSSSNGGGGDGTALDSSPLLPHFVEASSAIKHDNASSPSVHNWRNIVKQSVAVCDQLARMANRLSESETGTTDSGADSPGVALTQFNCPWTNIFTMHTVFGKSWKNEAASFLYNSFLLALQDAFLELHVHRLSEPVLAGKLTPKQLVEISLSPVVCVARQFLDNILSLWEKLNFAWLAAQGLIPARDYFTQVYPTLLGLMQLDYEVLHVLLPLFPDAPSSYQATMNLLSIAKEKNAAKAATTLSSPPPPPPLPTVNLIKEGIQSDGEKVSVPSFDELLKRAEVAASAVKLEAAAEPQETSSAAAPESHPPSAIDEARYTHLAICYNKVIRAKDLTAKLLSECFFRSNHFDAEQGSTHQDYKEFYDALRCRDPQTFFVCKYINQAMVIFQFLQLALERVLVYDESNFRALTDNLDRFFDSTRVLLCLSGYSTNMMTQYIQAERAKAQASAAMKANIVIPSNSTCRVFPPLITACDLAFDVWTLQSVAQMPMALLVGINRFVAADKVKKARPGRHKDWQKRPEMYRPAPVPVYKPPPPMDGFVLRTTIASTFDSNLAALAASAQAPPQPVK